MITYIDFVNSIPLMIIAASGLIIMLLETIFPHDKKRTIGKLKRLEGESLIVEPLDEKFINHEE